MEEIAVLGYGRENGGSSVTETCETELKKKGKLNLNFQEPEKKNKKQENL